MKNIESLKAQRAEVLRDLLELPEWVFGSLVETTRKHDGKEKAFRYLSRSLNGKNRITYVSKTQVERVAQAVESSKLARKLLNKVSELSLQIIKEEVRQSSNG